MKGWCWRDKALDSKTPHSVQLLKDRNSGSKHMASTFTPYTMAPTKMTPCKFFAQGFCRNGDYCDFTHEQNTSTQNYLGPVASSFPAIERLHINPGAATHLNREPKSTQICAFFIQGSCNRGDKCWYIHPPPIVPIHPDAISLRPPLSQQDESSPQAPSDSRASVPCKFLSRPGGCQKGSCPYLHAVDDNRVENSSSQDFEIDEDDASSYFYDLYRNQY